MLLQIIHPSQRAESLGTFRFWRDLGYATGALLTGILADYFGIEMSILLLVFLRLFLLSLFYFVLKNLLNLKIWEFEDLKMFLV
jgi:hypothetical protein